MMTVPHCSRVTATLCGRLPYVFHVQTVALIAHVSWRCLGVIAKTTQELFGGTHERTL